MTARLYTNPVFLPIIMLSDDQVRHTAKLARINLTDEEVKKFSGQLSKVIDYMKILNEVNTEKVEPTSQVTGLQNVMEADMILPAQSSKEELLGCTELPIDSDQIRTDRAISPETE